MKGTHPKSVTARVRRKKRATSKANTLSPSARSRANTDTAKTKSGPGVGTRNLPTSTVVTKPVFHNQQAYSEGWGLFTADSGLLMIQRLDDPPNARPLDCECDNTHEKVGTCCRACWAAGFRRVAPDDPVFESDEDALWYVMKRAAYGSKYHRRAIALAAGIAIPLR